MTGAVPIVLAALSLTGCEPAVGVYDRSITWQASAAVGRTSHGGLRRGVRLPAEGPHHVTYDPGRRSVPSRPRGRWGTSRSVRTTLCVIEDYRRAHPDAPRVVVGDLSRPRGGTFEPRFGGLGHVSHQNGRDIDVYYPRWDGRETAPPHEGDVDLTRAQELVDRFVAAGATLIVVGPGHRSSRLREAPPHHCVRRSPPGPHGTSGCPPAESSPSGRDREGAV